MSRNAAALVALAVLLAGCTGSAPAPAPSNPAETPANIDVWPTPNATDSNPAGRTVLATGLDVPWDLAALPDGSVLVTLRDKGELVRVVNGQTNTVGRVEGVVPGGEGGLLGIALSPTFASDQLVFLYFTAADDNRVVRYRYAETGLSDPQPIVTGIPKSSNHNGGRLRFGPDGNLYIGTGDAGRGAQSQDKASLGGKILRVTPDGGVPADNPFPDSPVYSYGHRNVQGLGWDLAGQLYASEFGQDRWDELNLIQPGGNYGWPDVEGRAGKDGFVDPALVWKPSEASPSGIAVTFGGTVYVAALRGERVWSSTRDASGMTDPDVLLDDLGRVRAVEVVDDQLYVLTNNTARGNPRKGDDRLVAVLLA